MPGLTQDFRSEYGCDFFQILRIAENRNRDKPRIGDAQKLSEDYVSLEQCAESAFGASSVKKVECEDDNFRIVSRFAGLFGNNGGLPMVYTQHVYERMLHFKDTTAYSFINIFNHRAQELFYKAWRLNDRCADFDRPEESVFSAYMQSFLGLGSDASKERDSVCDTAKFYYACHLGGRARTSEGLAKILGDYFQVPAAVENFKTIWLLLPDENRTVLSKHSDGGMLGSNAILGERILDCQMKYRVRLGPVGIKDFERFVPGRPSLKSLVDWCRLYTGFEFMWDLQVVLKAEEVPSCRLGGAYCLGWNTWVKTKNLTKDAGDMILNPENYKEYKNG